MNKLSQRVLAVLFALLIITGAVATYWVIDNQLLDTTDGTLVDSDNDGLTDTFEETVASTDPHDPDSDAAKTERNEGDNGVNDGKERLGDTPLTLLIQQRIGADPFSDDTDGDGLTDMFEVVDLGLIYNTVDATDTDGDGVSDGKEDPDNDTLTNRREQEIGTDPLDDDTDSDGLTDDYEVAHDLDPLVADGDDDGVDDGSEFAIGTDPAKSDTDGDGTPDGNETHTVTRANETLNVSLIITGEGDPANSLSVTVNDTIKFTNISAAVSPVVELDTNSSFSRATVTIAYNDSQVSAANESDLAIYTFNESKGTFVKLDSTVNAANNTVAATTPHFSTFAVFNVRNWNAQFDTSLPTRGSGTTEPKKFIDAQLVIDVSPSMKENDPKGYRKTAAKRFIDALIAGDRVGVISYGAYPVIKQGLTTKFIQAKSSIDQLRTITGTDIRDGLDTGIDALIRESNASRSKIIILLTDGQHNRGPTSEVLEQAKRAAAHNITIYTIGFGDADKVLLRYIATITGGEFHYVDTASGLPQIFSRVSENTTKGKDSDGDGLPDVVEIGGIRTGTGKIYHTQPDEKDSDGDGIPDGVEIGHRVDDLYYTVFSNPADWNSDWDNLHDREEYELGTDPLDSDTDDDGMDDDVDEKPLVPTTKEADGRQAKAIIAGAIFGQTGMKGGWAHEIVGDLASSPYYLVGWLAFSFVPIAGALGDIRDAVQNFINGDKLSAALDAFGIVPGPGDVTKAIDTIHTFLAKGDTSKKAVETIVAGVFLTPDWIPDFFKKEILKYITNKRSKKLIRNGVPADDIATYVEKGINLKLINKLRKMEIPADDLRRYVDKGVDLNIVKDLKKEGIPAGHIFNYVKQNFDLGRMSKAVDLYKRYRKNGGKKLSNVDKPKSVLSEIVARDIITNKYPLSKYKLKMNVKFISDGDPKEAEVDWVVINKRTKKVVAIYEVKGEKSERLAREAREQHNRSRRILRNNTRIQSHRKLKIKQFRRTDITYYAVGPLDAKPSANYDERLNIKSSELKALSNTIEDIEI